MSESDSTGKINNALLHKTKILEADIERLQTIRNKCLEICEDSEVLSVLESYHKPEMTKQPSKEESEEKSESPKRESTEPGETEDSKDQESTESTNAQTDQVESIEDKVESSSRDKKYIVELKNRITKLEIALEA